MAMHTGTLESMIFLYQFIQLKILLFLFCLAIGYNCIQDISTRVVNSVSKIVIFLPTKLDCLQGNNLF